MAQVKQVNAIAVGAVGIGLVFIWAGIKGASVLTSLQELVQGKRPSWKQTNPITVPKISTGYGSTADAAVGPAGGGKSYCASEFGGPGDPGTGSVGYRGDHLNGKMAYAELNMGKAMGGLPYKQKARISYNGKSVVAEKLDIGSGGGPCGGHVRGIDLWYETANAIGFSGLGVVQVELL